MLKFTGKPRNTGTVENVHLTKGTEQWGITDWMEPTAETTFPKK